MGLYNFVHVQCIVVFAKDGGKKKKLCFAFSHACGPGNLEAEATMNFDLSKQCSKFDESFCSPGKILEKTCPT